jgi:hypothetical protein
MPGPGRSLPNGWPASANPRVVRRFPPFQSVAVAPTSRSATEGWAPVLRSETFRQLIAQKAYSGYVIHAEKAQQVSESGVTEDTQRKEQTICAPSLEDYVGAPGGPMASPLTGCATRLN